MSVSALPVWALPCVAVLGRVQVHLLAQDLPQDLALVLDLVLVLDLGLVPVLDLGLVPVLHLGLLRYLGRVLDLQRVPLHAQRGVLSLVPVQLQSSQPFGIHSGTSSIRLEI